MSRQVKLSLLAVTSVLFIMSAAMSFFLGDVASGVTTAFLAVLAIGAFVLYRRHPR